jgi:class 3 adenylate cyclase
VLDVRFARSGDVDVAYFVVGSGQLPLVWVMGAYQHLETAWSFPPYRRFCELLGEFTRLIVFDKRGMGMSSRVAGDTPFETRMDDIRAVLDAEGIERAALLGESEGGPLAMLFAAAHPERVSHLVLQGAEVRESQDDDWPWGHVDDASFERWTQNRIQQWGKPTEIAGRLFGEEAADQAWINEWIARLQRNAASPREYAAFARTAYETDVRNLARSVRVPTLVLHCVGDRVCDVGNGRYLAGAIPGATYVERPGTEHIAWLTPNGVIPDIREFLTGERESVAPDRVLATILYTDVVGSTARASAMGDEQWRSLLQTHHAAVRDAFTRFRGQELTAEGDGFLARFDGPARAIRCARAIIEDARRIGLDVRAGVHTGEVEVIGDDVAGIALHIGARIGALAQGAQVLVSGAVRDIVAGSGLTFSDAGDHELRGVPGTWRVYAVD